MIEEALSDAEKGDYLVCQLEISQKIVRYALQRAKEKGMITVLNPAPAAVLEEGILESCDYFIPNQSEAEFYTGIYPKEEASAKQCAEALAAKGVKKRRRHDGSGRFGVRGRRKIRQGGQL